MLGSSLIDNLLFSMNGPHMGYHVRRTRNVPDSTNHSLYLIKMLSSNPEGKRWILPFFFCSIIERSALARYNIFIIRSKKEHSSDYLFSELRAIHTTPHRPTPNHPTTQPRAGHDVTRQHTTKKTKTHTYTHMCMHMYLYVYLYMYVYVYVYIYVYMYVYIYLTKKRTFHDVYCSKPLTFHNG